MVDLSQCYLHCLGTKEAEKLAELRALVPKCVEEARAESADAAAQADLTVYQVKIDEKSDASDVVLLKYLRAEELDVSKAAERIKQTLIFRYDCRIDSLRDAELPEHFRGHDFLTGLDEEGRPIMISRFGSMNIDAVFGDTEAFVRYRAKLMEQGIAELKFERGAAEDLVQVHDYSGVLGSMYKSEVKNGVSAVSKVFGEHYPEFKGKTLFINFPGVFAKPFQAFVLLLPARTQKKFVVLAQDEHYKLFEHLDPGFVPEVLGGMRRDPPGELTGKCKVLCPGARGAEEANVLEVEGAATVLWELRVCALTVSYKVLFIPNDGAEEVIAQSEPGKQLEHDAGVVHGSWDAKAPGKVVVRFTNDAAWFRSRVCVCRAGVRVGGSNGTAKSGGY